MNAITATQQTVIAANVAAQMANLENADAPILSPGSIKGAMKAANDGAAGKSRDLWQVPPQKLRVVADLNPRVETPAYLQHVRELADSMKEHGFFQDKPLAGYVAEVDGEDVIYIVEGGSRLRAALLAIEEGAKFNVVPVSVDQKGLNVEDLLVRMVRSNTGRPLSQYEVAIVCKRLARFSWESAQIAAQLGISVQQVENSLLLMGADERVRQLVGAEILAFTYAVEVLKEHGAKAFEFLMKAQEKANAEGKTRITKRHAVGATFKKELTKAADPMFHLLASIKADAAFEGLCDTNKAKLMNILTSLQAHKAAETPAADGAVAEQGGDQAEGEEQAA
jgi:ParB family chromosome partitioning protein